MSFIVKEKGAIGSAKIYLYKNKDKNNEEVIEFFGNNVEFEEFLKQNENFERVLFMPKDAKYPFEGSVMKKYCDTDFKSRLKQIKKANPGSKMNVI